MRKAIPLFVFALVIAAQPVLAQKPASTASMAVSSEPGKASVVAAAKITATVTAVDKATRAITLKLPDGKVEDLVASDEVRNFDQIKVGDTVTVGYMEALSLQLKKSTATGAPTETTAMARAKPGEKPGGVVGREVTVLADVVAVDPKASTITLKGPAGKSVELKVQNPDQFKVVKVGDKVEAVYTQALAVSVTAAKPAAAK